MSEQGSRTPGSTTDISATYRVYTSTCSEYDPDSLTTRYFPVGTTPPAMITISDEGDCDGTILLLDE